LSPVICSSCVHSLRTKSLMYAMALWPSSGSGICNMKNFVSTELEELWPGHVKHVQVWTVLPHIQAAGLRQAWVWRGAGAPEWPLNESETSFNRWVKNSSASSWDLPPLNRLINARCMDCVLMGFLDSGGLLLSLTIWYRMLRRACVVWRALNSFATSVSGSLVGSCSSIERRNKAEYSKTWSVCIAQRNWKWWYTGLA
jgi:hypothetical protein